MIDFCKEGHRPDITVASKDLDISGFQYHHDVEFIQNFLKTLDAKIKLTNGLKLTIGKRLI